MAILLRSMTTGERFAAQVLPTGSWLISAPLSQAQVAELETAIAESSDDYTIDGEIYDARPSDLQVVSG